MLTSSAHADAAYAEPLRPQFHFTSNVDWLNDPNGCVFIDGQYQLCFQRTVHNTDGNAPKAWGRAFSPDLVHWTQTADDAISSDGGGGIWSGSAVVDWNNTSGFGVGGRPPIVMAYTNAVEPFDQRIVYSTDNGKTYTKFGKPILANIHAKNRDPKLIWHEATKRWILALYLDEPHHFALFGSSNLKDWTKLQDLTLDGDDECPDLFPLNLDGDPAKPMWVFTAASGRYVVGDFDGQTFTPKTDSIPGDLGPGFYAAQTFSDVPKSDGRRIQIAWLRDGRFPGMPFNQQMTFPCELTLRSTPRGPRLFKWPVKEIESLYGTHTEFAEFAMEPDKDMLDGLSGELFDLTCEIGIGDAKSVTLNVRDQPITFHAESATTGSLTCWDRRVSVPLTANGRIRLRVLLDRTSLEIFANDGATVVSGSFHPPQTNRQLTLIAEGGTARLITVFAERLNSAWPVPTK